MDQNTFRQNWTPLIDTSGIREIPQKDLNFSIRSLCSRLGLSNRPCDTECRLTLLPSRWARTRDGGLAATDKRAMSAVISPCPHLGPTRLQLSSRATYRRALSREWPLFPSDPIRPRLKIAPFLCHADQAGATRHTALVLYPCHTSVHTPWCESLAGRRMNVKGRQHSTKKEKEKTTNKQKPTISFRVRPSQI